jgi:hypothetical protein
VPVTGRDPPGREADQARLPQPAVLFPTYEHFSHPIHDEWAEGARYASQFTREKDPAAVTYIRSMPFERTVETGPDQGKPVAGCRSTSTPPTG